LENGNPHPQYADADHEHEVAAVAWIDAELVAPWVNFGGVYQTAQYRKVDDTVELRGLVKDGGAATIFTMPAGYRPAAREIFIGSSNNESARIDINSDGEVILASFGNHGSNAFLSLAGIRFSVTA
jgi:hypothetical protein